MVQAHSQIRFKRNASIGAAEAESDGQFLETCFVETGDLDVLIDCSGPKRIILGRTGSGKSALLQKIKDTQENVILLYPEDLSLNYLSNSSILLFFDSIGLKLETFYGLLWRHVITVELLKKKYKITNEQKQASFLQSLSGIIQKNKAKQQAIDYVIEWGEKFWIETEYRVKELTKKLESDLTAACGAKIGDLELSAKTASKLTEEQKTDIISRGNNAVERIQVKKLSDVINLLDEDIFLDGKERFYILIDKLDDDWVDGPIRYKLIRSLLETVRTFQRVHAVKIVVALRSDLLQKVLMETKSEGFQEEKYESLYLRLKWNKNQLRDILERRVNFLFKSQYTNQRIKLEDILPPKRQGDQVKIDYIFDRTFLRPREAILFVNECIEKSEDETKISERNFSSAESTYSIKRLRSLEDEWERVFPKIKKYFKVLIKKPHRIRVKDISTEALDDLVVELIDDAVEFDSDPVAHAARAFFNESLARHEFIDIYVRSLYQIGIIGIKPDSFSKIQWSHADDPIFPAGIIEEDTQLQVHPTFWRALGTPVAQTAS